MKPNIVIVIVIVILIGSCQKEEITTNNSKDNLSNQNEIITPKSASVATDSIFVFVGSAPNPTINGEVQLALNNTFDYPISVHFMIKKNKTFGDNLFSNYYTIPAGQRYLTCDIDEYLTTTKKLVTKTSIDDSGNFTTITDTLVMSGTTDVYLQICDVQTASSGSNIYVDYSIVQIKHTLDGISILFPYKAYNSVNLSELSCSKISFYKPVPAGGDGEGPIPKDPIDGSGLPVL